MSSHIRLIVGLGNPGEKYEKTRHNAGAWFISALSQSTLRPNSKLYGQHALSSLHGHECHLLIPTTFMNLSGQAVRAVADYYKIPTDAILIVHDEIDLPAGDIRLKFDGGHGGHNGLRDIIRHLSSNRFHRLRIGVGRPNHSKEVIDYVLKPPSQAERQAIELAIQKGHSVLPDILSGRIQKAMQQLHTESKA